MVAFTVFVEESYSKLETLIPFGFSVGIITGLLLLKVRVFFLIITLFDPTTYCRSTSSSFFFVSPSITVRFGGDT